MRGLGDGSLSWIWISMDIRGYISMWISDLSHAVDISVDMRYRYLIVNR